MEVWKDIKGYEGLYQISNLGRVKGLERITSQNKHIEEYILKIRKENSRGYSDVGLTKDGKQKRFTIHRLVAEAFIPNPNNLQIVNHKDEDKTNNCVDNLEWCDAKYNVVYTKEKHPEQDAKKSKGNNYNSKKVICVNDGNVFNSIIEASEYYNLHSSSVSKVCRGIQKQTNGYIFKYYKKGRKKGNKNNG